MQKVIIIFEFRLRIPVNEIVILSHQVIMDSCHKNELRYIKIQWIIKNFDFCWHKTGERLESPVFNVDFTNGTTWRLWLYPRGEDDGEYASFFLFREAGGPAIVHVDFELCFYINRRLRTGRQTLRENSFNIHQREGFKCFAPRCEIFPQKAYNKGSYLLRLECKIFNLKMDGLDNLVRTLWTTIGMERVYGTEICDNVTDLEPHCNKDIVVKPLLENEPLINLNISYFENNLVVKMLPVNCEKIKYAICKVTIINNLWKESAIEHVRSWIGEIKQDIWRHRVFHTETESFTDKTLFVHYDFAFSTGELASAGVEQYDEFLMTTNVFCLQYVNAKSRKFAPTALDALEETYRSQSYIDIQIETKTKTYPAHKAILCTRSPIFKSFIKEKTKEVIFLCSGYNCEELFRFLYTDNLTISISSCAFQLYILSLRLENELFKTHIRNLLVRNLHELWAVDMLDFSVKHKDSFFQAAVENYIMAHYDSILHSKKWQSYRNEKALCKKVILLRYKKQHLR